MIERRARVLLCVFYASLLGCSARVDHANDVGSISEALSACDETVPANRNVDGIPAYAQCDAVAAGAIYRTTASIRVRRRWAQTRVKTQYSGGYQCTEFAHRYLYFKWDVMWIPNGNAGQWCDTQPPASSGMVQTTTPVHGDLMVLAPGSCGSSPSTGHVNVIDTVDGNGRVTAVEQNVAGRHQYMQTCGKCFLHVVANDGSGAGGAGVSGSGGAMAGAGGAMTGAGGAVAGGGGSPAMTGAGGSSGAGGMAAPMQMPQAGTFAPPELPPAKAPPLAPATAPGSAGASAPASTAPATTTPELTTNRQPAEGCSVARVGAETALSPLFPAAFALLLGARRARRRARRVTAVR